MRKNEARKIAIDYLYAAADDFYRSNSKTTIDDVGTLSEDGYSDVDCGRIEKELNFIMKKVLNMQLKTTTI